MGEQIETESNLVERVAIAMHDAYEEAAKIEGWKTQECCRVPFDKLPAANKRTMYASAKAAMDLLAKPQAATSPAIQVKQLVWESLDRINHRHEAATEIYYYHISSSEDGWHVSLRGSPLIPYFGSLELAKAACQADYEQRILSGIVL